MAETAVLRHIKTNALYRHIAGNEYENIMTGQRGEVPEDVARKIFVINVDATGICNRYPLVEEIIKQLQLKIEKQ
jgi:hypothetical protein